MTNNLEIHKPIINDVTYLVAAFDGFLILRCIQNVSPGNILMEISLPFLTL